MAELDDARLDDRNRPAAAPAVERDPRPGQVEGIVGPERDAGRRGQRCASRGNGGDDRAEGGELRRVRRMAGRLGAGEVAVERIDGEPVEQARRGFRRGQAEPVDAGIDHDVARPAAGCLAPRRDLPRGVEHRHRGAGERRRQLAVLDAVEDREPGAVRHRAERRRLVPRRDEEVARAGGGQRRDDGARAEAVGVGLDRRAGRRPGQREIPPIGRERGGIDGKAQIGGGHRPRA